MNGIKLWSRAVRAPFYTATIVSGLLGGAIAWNTDGIRWGVFFITLLGILAVHSGTNLINDYFDHKSGLDEKNKTPTPFSGGSRIIQEKLISPRTILFAALFSFLSAILIGLYLNHITPGNIIIYIGLIGIFFSFFYTAGPIRLGYTPLSELVTGISCGPLIVMGTYYIQTNAFFPMKPLIASIPIGLMVFLILYINEFPDHDNDKLAGKKHIVILLGKRKASWLYVFLLISVYLFILICVIFKFLPVYSLLAFVTIPLAVKAIKTTLKNYDQIEKLFPANAATIQIHLMLGILLTLSFIIDKLL